ncbi:MAG: NUDIX domain-containing protein [Kibdelosporangium sp.]
MVRDAFCSTCGTRYDDVSGYPRQCAACGNQVWVNPKPVAVVLLPVIDGARTGLLVIRRAIPPVGILALIGGFVEPDESWQESAARELWEEAAVVVAPAALEPLWFTSTEPDPNFVLLFSVAPAVQLAELPPFVSNSEVSERGVIFGATGEGLGFPLHTAAARRYFAGIGVDGPLDFVPL